MGTDESESIQPETAEADWSHFDWSAVDVEGVGLLKLTTAATILLVPAVAVMVWNPWGLGAVGAGVAVAMFVVGMVTNVWAFLIAVERSRTETISVGLLWFLPKGVAPPAVQRRVHAATVAQVVLGVVGASLRPFTVAAFGVLAWLLGLGIGGLWSARHGRFPPK